ncbi:MAG: 2-amino-4-hydroxy-6-hydroxymethyldihydropteridine diphosphokinase [Marmoricola sp.]
MTQMPHPNFVDTDTLTGEMHPIRRAVICLGSNLGERLSSLQGAVDSLKDTPEVWLTDVSPVYETASLGGPADAPDYLNAIVLLDTTLSVHRLLERALAIEEAFGRERSTPNAPRTLDVDLIVVGDRRANDEQLTLPHPRAAERAFVLQPWFDLEPHAAIPGAGLIADLLESVDTAGITRRDDAVLHA